MAGQRMLHPEQSTSRKVTALSDFEYRVWEQTKLSADDFGVLPYDALTLRAENSRLKKRATERQVVEALETLVRLHLLLTFEHQGEMYACAPVWQTWQQVRYPRKTSRPKPPAAVLALCDEATVYLFSIHPGGCALPAKKKQRDSGEISKSLQSESEATVKSSAVCGAEVPANANAHANAHGFEVVLPEGGPGETAAPSRRDSVADRARAVGIVSPGQWDRQHGSHAHRADFCGWVCLPQAVHSEFVNRVVGAGSSLAEAEASVHAWELDVKARWAGQIPGEDSFKFWRAEWAATHPARRASATPAPGAGLDALIAAAGKAAANG